MFDISLTSCDIDAEGVAEYQHFCRWLEGRSDQDFYFAGLVIRSRKNRTKAAAVLPGLTAPTPETTSPP